MIESGTAAVILSLSVDVMMAVAFYIPIATGTLFILPIGSMAVGAYAGAEVLIHGGSFPEAAAGGAIAGCALAAAGGLVVARLGLWSAAIASFSIAEIVAIFFQNFSPTGGAEGLLGVPLATSSVIVESIAALLVVGMFVIETRRLGLVLEAVRGDEVGAGASGIRTLRIRLIAFAFSGVVAGIAGAANAGFLGFVDPSTFGFTNMNQYMLGTIFGGTTTVLGPLVGGVGVNILPILFASFTGYTLLISGVLVLVVMLVRREGLLTRRGLRVAARVGGGIVARVGPRRVATANSLASVSGGPTRKSSEGIVVPRGRIAAVEVRGLTKRFGGVTAFRDVKLSLHTGHILGVVGANGAGKTTLLNVVSGVTLPSAGGVYLDGRRYRIKSPDAAVKMGIARTFQNPRLFPQMTVEEHVSLIDPAAAVPLLGYVNLGSRAKDTAMALPYGEQKRLEIARALATRPDFLLVDEPTAGMTLGEAREVAEILIGLRDSGLGVVVVDHNVPFVLSITDRIIALDFGEIMFDGAPTAFLHDPLVIQAYLGTRDYGDGGSDGAPPGGVEAVAASGEGAPGEGGGIGDRG